MTGERKHRPTACCFIETPAMAETPQVLNTKEVRLVRKQLLFFKQVSCKNNNTQSKR